MTDSLLVRGWKHGGMDASPDSQEVSEALSFCQRDGELWPPILNELPDDLMALCRRMDAVARFVDLPPILCSLIAGLTCSSASWLLFLKRRQEPVLCWATSAASVDLPATAAGGNPLEWTLAQWRHAALALLAGPGASAGRGPGPSGQAVAFPLVADGEILGVVMVVPSEECGNSALNIRHLGAVLVRAAEVIRYLLLREERDALREQLACSRSDLARLRQRIMLSERLASIGELVSGVAHELNNPLTSVLGYAQLLQDDEGPEEIRAGLAIIDSEAQRCQRIVQNLLSIARQQPLDLNAVAVDEAIRRSLELKAYALRNDNIRVELALTPGPPVLANMARLQQVLLNLISNAQEAMSQAHGGGVLRIESYVIQEEERAVMRIVVEDDGPGVAENLRERIFEPFFSTKWEQQGTGLGLAISRQIVQELGGRLTLNDAFTNGAQFLIDLPTAVADGPSPVSPSDDQTWGEKRDAMILLVDDEADLVELVERFLNDAGLRVVSALSGDEAVQRLAERRYDLVLLDVKMPGLNGREVYDLICAQYPALATRVILMTGDLVSSETTAWLQSTGCIVLEKPFALAQLMRVVNSILERAAK